MKNNKQNNLRKMLTVKNISIFFVCITVIILAIFGFAFSETLENAITFIFCIISFGLLFLTFYSSSFVFTRERYIFFSILGGFIVTGLIGYGLYSWSVHNDGRRREWRTKDAKEKAHLIQKEQQREDSIQHIKDSIQNYKDSLAMVEASKKIFEKEGNLIFGQFNFGMSKAEFDKVSKVIDKETNGLISIAGNDFRITDANFVKDKMYRLKLESARKWNRYFYYEDSQYEEENDGSEIVAKIKEHIAKKYGEPNHYGEWHFLHKDISIKAGSLSSEKIGLVREEKWGVVIYFTNPELYNESQLLKKEEKEKAERERQKVELALQKKKESFSSGL